MIENCQIGVWALLMALDFSDCGWIDGAGEHDIPR
jgi:hypothetical protein